MERTRTFWLNLLAFSYLFRYDLIAWARGFKGNYEGMSKQPMQRANPGAGVCPQDITRAVDVACALYWKRVLCLQRSISEAALLRRFGWNAEVVIGYRLMPFCGHAWVEVEGLASPGSREYQKQLFVLDRIGAVNPPS